MEHKFSFRYQRVALPELPEPDRTLVEQARRACSLSYAPYSHFKVGAAARLADGRTETGANQESEALPSGICAERALLFAHQTMNAGNPIEALAIASVPEQSECYPCGACRQVLLDTERRQGSPIRIIMAGAHTATVVDSAADLLPFQFEI